MMLNAWVEEVPIGYLMERDNGKCQLCGKKTLKWYNHSKRSPTIDHIVPLDGGGEHSKRNTQLACMGCNSRKSNKGGGQMRLAG